MKNWPSFLMFAMFMMVGPITATETSFLCDGPPQDLTRIDRVQVLNDDLTVDVSWSALRAEPTEATIEVLDRGGAVRSSAAVTVAPERTVRYRMTNGPAFFEDHGYWYTIRITDSAGMAWVEDTPILIAPCSPGAGCNFSVVEGAGTDTLVMGAELSEVLDTLEASGSRDLLNAAFDRRPELGHQIEWLGDQIIRVQDGTPGQECLCRWTAVYDPLPISNHALPDVTKPSVKADRTARTGGTTTGVSATDWQMRLYEDPSGSFYMAGQLIGGSERTASTDRVVSVSLQLRCWWVNNASRSAGGIAGPGLPVLEACRRDCPDARVEVEAEIQSEAAANAWASAHHGARAEASAFGAAFLNQQLNPVLMTSAAIVADRVPGDFALATLLDSPGVVAGSWLHPGPEASLSFATQGHIEMCLAAYGPATHCSGSFPSVLGVSVPWAYGCSAVSTRAVLTGEASCAVQPVRTVALVSTITTQNGLVILPWNP